MSDTASSAARLPLSALLSQVLVAFIIECDNEFERQMPHRTSNHGRTAGQRSGPWLVSMAMWWTCLRFVGADGIAVAQLASRARTGTNLGGMLRWGYITVAPDPADSRPKPPRSAWVIHATDHGRKAQEIWRPLAGVIEERWAARFGVGDMTALREALHAIVGQLDPALPDCLPILGYGLWSTPEQERPGRERPAAKPARRSAPATEAAQAGTELSTLLSRALLAFAIEFERGSTVSLAIAANVLRVLDEHGVPVRDLPGPSGVSSEGISMAMGVLARQGLAVTAPAPDGGRGQVARLTPRGRNAQNKCAERLATIEQHWQERFGDKTIAVLREALEQLARGPGGPGTARLFAGLEPPPGGWRAAARTPAVLPQYPMVLHRGGFPDGS